jgi:hypothetical protein
VAVVISVVLSQESLTIGLSLSGEKYPVSLRVKDVVFGFFQVSVSLAQNFLSKFLSSNTEREASELC